MTETYRIRVSLDHISEEVYRDIYVPKDTLLSVLKDAILKFFGLNRKMIASFFLCNEHGDSEEEIISEELGEEGFRTLNQVTFAQVVEQKKNLVFAAHGIKMRFFHVEILGKKLEDLNMPKLEKTHGQIPRNDKKN